MSTPSFQAVYENGVLRPLEPLALPERQVVSLAIVPEGPVGLSDPDDSSRQGKALEAWLDEVGRLPPEGPADGLSNRDHDQFLANDLEFLGRTARSRLVLAVGRVPRSLARSLLPATFVLLSVVACGHCAAGSLVEQPHWTSTTIIDRVAFDGPGDTLNTVGPVVDGYLLAYVDFLGYADRVKVWHWASTSTWEVNVVGIAASTGGPGSDGYTRFDLRSAGILARDAVFYEFAGGYMEVTEEMVSNAYGTNIFWENVWSGPAPAGAVLRMTWETLDPPHGDIDHDGAIDFADFAILKQNMFTRPGRLVGGDITGDHAVWTRDFEILKQNFGWKAVPEPHSFGLLAFGGVLVLVSLTFWSRMCSGASCGQV